MNSCRNVATNAVGFCLLPLELIQEILLRLPLPDIIRLKSLCTTLNSVITGDDFHLEYNAKSRSDTWIFVYKKRWPRDSTLHGFTDRSDRWFRIPVDELLCSVVPPGEDLYLLTAAGGVLLFAMNKCCEVIAVNLTTKSVKKIPTSPLGPRGTSSLRRSGLKLIAGPPGSGHFRFMFAELHENRPVLFEYSSETNMWRSREARERAEDCPRGSQNQEVCLDAVHRMSESVVVALVPGSDAQPLILRPRFNWERREDRLEMRCLRVYGDGKMMIVRSEGVDEMRMLTCIEMWGLSLDGRCMEVVSQVPDALVDRIKKPFRVMMGCLEERDGVVRVVLVSYIDRFWDFVWLSYDLRIRLWTWVPLSECEMMKGSNMAGIILSSGPIL